MVGWFHSANRCRHLVGRCVDRRNLLNFTKINPRGSRAAICADGQTMLDLVTVALRRDLIAAAYPRVFHNSRGLFAATRYQSTKGGRTPFTLTLGRIVGSPRSSIPSRPSPSRKPPGPPLPQIDRPSEWRGVCTSSVQHWPVGRFTEQQGQHRDDRGRRHCRHGLRFLLR